jgi:hypothetical protein
LVGNSDNSAYEDASYRDNSGRRAFDDDDNKDGFNNASEDANVVDNVDNGGYGKSDDDYSYDDDRGRGKSRNRGDRGDSGDDDEVEDGVYEEVEVEEEVEEEVEIGEGCTILHLCCLRDYPLLVQWLLAVGGADATVLDGFGVSPLQMSVAMGHAKVTRYLAAALPRDSEIFKAIDRIAFEIRSYLLRKHRRAGRQ